MIFYPASRDNAIKNNLLAGVGVILLPYLNTATADYYAGSNGFLHGAIPPAVVRMIISAIDFSRKHFFNRDEACKAQIIPAGNFKITYQGI